MSIHNIINIKAAINVFHSIKETDFKDLKLIHLPQSKLDLFIT